MKKLARLLIARIVPARPGKRAMARTIEASALAQRNPKFFSMMTQSLGVFEFSEPDVEPIHLGPDADDELLGRRLRQSLSKCRTVSVDEVLEMSKSGILEQRAKERELWRKKTYGFRTKRALLQDMHWCMVRVSEGQIEISPTDRHSFQGLRETSNGAQDIIYLSVSVSDAEVGAALREGFNRCTCTYSD